MNIDFDNSKSLVNDENIVGWLNRLKAEAVKDAVKGQTLMTTTAVTRAFMSAMEEIDESSNTIEESKADLDEKLLSEINSTIFQHESQIPAHSTALSVQVNSSNEIETPSKELLFSDNWRNLGEDQMQENVVSENLDAT